MEKIPNSGGPSKRSVWERVRKTAKMAALAALFTQLPLDSVAQTQSVEVGPDNKENVEQMIEETERRVTHMLEVMSESGKDVKIPQISAQVKRADLPTGQVIEAAYGMESPAFLFLSTHDGVNNFLDIDADGRVDKYVFNENDFSKSRREEESKLRILTDIDELAENVEMVNSLNPEDVTVLSIDREGGETLAKVVNYSNGEAVMVEGFEAEKLAKSLQDFYSEQIEIITTKNDSVDKDDDINKVGDTD